MLATLSTTIFDASGFVELELLPDHSDGEVRRRVNRVATLDGGAVVSDAGFSHADRTMQLRWQPRDKATEDDVERLVRTYATLAVSTRSGVFLASPESYTPTATESSLRLLVLEKLSA